jgi:hypothetical protein
MDIAILFVVHRLVLSACTYAKTMLLIAPAWWAVVFFCVTSGMVFL